jgi:hypothetical protein
MVNGKIPKETAMTLTADHNIEMPTVRGITYVLNGSRFVARFACKLGAVSLGLAAVLLWVAPGAAWESDVMLFKLVLSVGAVYLAIALLQMGKPVAQPSVEVDIARGELRLIREENGSLPVILERCAFADLQAVDLCGSHITFWANGGRLLAEISLSNANAHAALLARLRGLGKLA